MPTYRVTNPETGQTISMTGDGIPTEQDIQAAFGAIDGSGGVNTPSAPQMPENGQQSALNRASRGSPSAQVGAVYAPIQSGQSTPSIKQMAGMVADVGLEGGGAAIGQAAGALAGPFAPAAVPAFGAIGGMAGNALSQARRMAMGEQQGFRAGETVGAAIGGAVPGASMARAGAGRMAARGLAEGAANVGALTAQSVVDTGELPSLGQAELAGLTGMVAPAAGRLLDTGKGFTAIDRKKIENAVRDQTLREAQAVGYVFSPSKINPSPVNNLLESIAGKAATAQEVALRAQEITNALARKEIGLPVSAPITEASINNVRQAANKAYEAVAGLSPDASKSLQELRDVRNAATQYFRHFDRMADPESLRKAQASHARAEELEDELELIAAYSHTGQSYLVDDLRQARKLIAKTHQVEQALNLGDGNVSAAVLGRALDRGAPLTGNLATIAKTQQAFPGQLREAASVPSSGVSQLRAAGAAVAGGLGGIGAGLATLAAPGIAREGVLSPTYQRIMAVPNYGTARPNFAAELARLSTQAAGR